MAPALQVSNAHAEWLHARPWRARSPLRRAPAAGRRADRCRGRACRGRVEPRCPIALASVDVYHVDNRPQLGTRADIRGGAVCDASRRVARAPYPV